MLELNKKQATSFQVDVDLLKTAAERLADKSRIYWLLGASCTGKTSVCARLAKAGITVLDMDSCIYGSYLEKYSQARHPASCAWLKRMDAMQWALSLSWEEFCDLNEATNAEILDLFAEEVHAGARTFPLVVDGGLCHPRLLSQVLPLGNVLCLQREEEARGRRMGM